MILHIKAAKDIFGKDIFYLKGKTTQTKLKVMTQNRMPKVTPSRITPER